jgi:serine protease Do
MTLAAAALALSIVPALLFAQPRREKAETGEPQTPSATQTRAQPPLELSEAAKNLEAIQYSFREVARKVLPVVVEIDVVEVVKQPTPQTQSPFDWFFNPPSGNGKGGQQDFQRSGLGSGIIVRHMGNRYYVLTNNHVVGEASEITVQLNDRRKFDAKLVGKDSRRDIALVSFDSTSDLPVADLGESGQLQAGDIVLAVGNPFGFESSITMGIVSAVGRQGPEDPDVAQYTDYIQTDAAINQGNSGGALVNIRGQVVGINTWIAAPTGGSIGLGFAIPIDNAKKDIDDFILTGKVQYGWLGVQITSIQDATAYPGFAGDLKVTGVNGAFVLNVYKGSPADRAGLLPGDYITRVGTQDIKDSNRLTQVVGGLIADKSYNFDLIRYGEKRKLSVTIGLRDDQDQVAQFKNLWPGMTVLDITDDIRQRVDIPADTVGVVVEDTPDNGTPASIAGFKAGDVITDINAVPVRNVMDFYRALNDGSGKNISFYLIRKGTELSIALGR